MKCPACHKLIAETSALCGYCGHRFSAEFHAKLTAYFELKEDLAILRDVAVNELAAGIERLSVKIEKQYGEEPVAAVRPPPPFEAPAAPAILDKRTLFASSDAAAWDKSDPDRSHLAPPPPRAEEEKNKQRDDLNFETAMGQKWLLIIGVVATVFGVGYFLKYSFDQGWVGPAGRVALAYLWGAAFLFGGNLFRRRGLENYGLYLSGGGIATLYFATFAAFQIYHLIGQAPSFLLMVMVTALAGTLAVIYDTKWLAVLGLIGGFLTPVLLGTGQDNQIVLMSYMTILNLGLLGVAFYKKWNLLTVLGFCFTYLLYTGWYARFYNPTKFWPALLFVNIFYLIYTVMPFITRFVREERAERDGFAVIVPNSFIAFGYSYYMVKAHFSLEAVGVVSVLYAAVFLGLASYVFKAGKQATEGFVVLAAKAMLFLVITVPIVFSKHWVSVFWTAQAMALMWMGLRLENKPLQRSSVILFFIAASKLFFIDYFEVFGLNAAFRIIPSYGYMLMERWITFVIFFLLLYLAADMAREKDIAVPDRTGEKAYPFLYGFLGGLLFVFLNMEVSAFFYDSLPAARFAAISVLWTLFSVGLIILGFRSRNALLRKTALTLFMATVIKVFFFDMANISTPYRIVSFIILGLLLVATSYLYHKYKHILLPELPAQEGEKA